jgi:hypothetical protein
MRKITILALAAALVAAMAAPAMAAPRAKGFTAIDVAPLIGLGAVDGLAQPASLDGTVVSFGIVGNPKDGTIEHVGGAVVLGVTLRNFTIDLNNGNVSGIVPGLGRVVLFDLDGLDVVLTAGAAGALGVPGLAGATVGTADISNWNF